VSESGIRVTLEFPDGSQKRTGLHRLPEPGERVETVDSGRRPVTLEVEEVILSTFPLNSESPSVARIRLRRS